MYEHDRPYPCEKKKKLSFHRVCEKDRCLCLAKIVKKAMQTFAYRRECVNLPNIQHFKSMKHLLFILALTLALPVGAQNPQRGT
ncbi:MAG: hypothetical protein J1F25_04335, partial [Prevotellaceae bacterium]|nr:hypothetical protein [Prevotellaceae bacterium]